MTQGIEYFATFVNRANEVEIVATGVQEAERGPEGVVRWQMNVNALTRMWK